MTVLTGIDTRKRGGDPFVFDLSPAHRLLGHRLGLHRIHPRESADTLLIELYGRCRFGALRLQRSKRGSALVELCSEIGDVDRFGIIVHRESVS